MFLGGRNLFIGCQGIFCTIILFCNSVNLNTYKSYSFSDNRWLLIDKRLKEKVYTALICRYLLKQTHLDTAPWGPMYSLYREVLHTVLCNAVQWLKACCTGTKQSGLTSVSWNWATSGMTSLLADCFSIFISCVRWLLNLFVWVTATSLVGFEAFHSNFYSSFWTRVHLCRLNLLHFFSSSNKTGRILELLGTCNR